MKVSKWVDFGQEVEVEIGLDDVRGAIGEACERVTRPKFDELPTRQDVSLALNSIGLFFKALTDEQIALLSQPARNTVSKFLSDSARRFDVGGLFVPAIAGGQTQRDVRAESQTHVGRDPVESAQRAISVEEKIL